MEMNLNTSNVKTNNLIQNDSIFYIFEIFIKYNDNKTTRLRRIKNCKYGDIIYDDDMILNNFSKFKITIFDINDPLNTMVLKKKFNDAINDIFLLNNDRIIFQFVLNEKDHINLKYRFLN
tara:strand:+ start:1808 stop:2167 length:360 start_codon:yes stop_codon:yes gene_type:complete